MINKKLTVIIAIPAYNEALTISNLLTSIERQKKNNFTLKKVWVFSDGSTDSTVEIISKNFKHVKVFNFKKNLGKIKRVNQILKLNTADILILADADITLSDSNTLDNLIKPFYNDKNVGVSCSYHLAKKPNIFFAKVPYFGFRIWDRARTGLKTEGIRYYCEGGLLAESKAFTKMFSLPDNRYIGDDSYTFYFAITKNFKVVVSKNAKVYFDLPEDFGDYAKQMRRFLCNPKMVNDLFGTNIVKKYEAITPQVKITAFIKEFLSTPLVGLFYIATQGLVYLSMPFYKPSKKWVSITRKH